MAKSSREPYEGLLRHYRLNGQKIQAGQANENGDWNNGIIGLSKPPIRRY
jgi:hypothetical protein